MKTPAEKARRRLPYRLTRTFSWTSRAWKGWCLAPLVSGRYELAISPCSLISAEYIDSLYSRYDTIVRYLAVEQFFEKNECGFELYRKMQAARGAPNGFEERFRHLIERVHRHGYDWRNALDVTRDGYLLNGSHRLALALYCDVPAIAVRPRYEHRGPVAYGLDWFGKNEFSEDECALIESRRQRLFWEKGLYFSVLLWPPVAEHFDRIQKDIPYKVVRSDDYLFGEQEFEGKVRAIYEPDDIAKWKVDKKLACMAPYEKRVRAIWVELPNPQYRKKRLNNADISRVGEKLKLLLRGKYKDTVQNYFYDIICHIGDNWQHNRQIMDILSPHESLLRCARESGIEGAVSESELSV